MKGAPTQKPSKTVHLLTLSSRVLQTEKQHDHQVIFSISRYLYIGCIDSPLCLLHRSVETKCLVQKLNVIVDGFRNANHDQLQLSFLNLTCTSTIAQSTQVHCPYGVKVSI
jgi:hypothetical protein